MCLKFPKFSHFCPGRNVSIFPSEETPQKKIDIFVVHLKDKLRICFMQWKLNVIELLQSYGVPFLCKQLPAPAAQSSKKSTFGKVAQVCCL